MTSQENPVIGAVVHQDGSLEPVRGADPSRQGTYREPDPVGADEDQGKT